MMLRILGSYDQTCNRISRRELLNAGILGAGAYCGLSADYAAAAVEGTGRAKRVILLYLYGAAAQHELYDPKPEAPAEVRGKFGAIPTAIPGVMIGEHLPKIAGIADRVTFVRSMTHPYNIHSAAYTMTGVPHVDIPMELNPHDSRHWPFFGSVLEYLTDTAGRASETRSTAGVPSNVALPFLFSSKSAEFQRGGPYGGFLGSAYNPVWTEFQPEGTRSVPRWRGNLDQAVRDPFAAIAPGDRLTLSEGMEFRQGVTLDRLRVRQSLLSQLDEARREADRSLPPAGFDHFADIAHTLISSRAFRDALDFSRESFEDRERYGMTLFGQSVLAGRRLLEAGANVVTVMWDEYGTANSAWDTHFNHYERLQNELLPGLDAALSSLILDLEDRGMLDDTLVMCLTEHGRTPKLSEKPRGVGREHWSNVYCNLLAGGGIAQGKVVGSSDAHGAFVDSDPVSPKDILCTMYHLLGIDPHLTIPDRLGRPLPLVSGGEVRPALLS